MTTLNVTTPTLCDLSLHPLPPLSRLLVAVTLIVVQWDLRRRTRKDLRRLPDFMLRDIGLDPSAALGEADKPFWRA
jgi:uncharacterized protein YjiS (DUF1127 family)